MYESGYEQCRKQLRGGIVEGIVDGADGGDGMGRQRDIEEGFWECCEEENKNTLCGDRLP